VLLRDYKPYDREGLDVEHLPGDAPNPREMDAMDERVAEYLDSMTLEEYVAAKGGLNWAADFIRQVIDRLDEPPQGTVLELGAGNAKLAAVLSTLPSVDEVVINDFSEPLLTELAPRVISWLGGDLSKIRFVVGDMHRLPEIGRQFDAVVGYLVVHHLVLPEHFFERLPAILKPGAPFIAFREPAFARVAIPNSWTTRVRRHIHDLRRAGENEHRYTVDGYAQLSEPSFTFKLLGIHDGSAFVSPRRQQISRLVSHVPYDIAYLIAAAR
jgi:ubiquinone/menaquinone biosynthesis C-methylase UbiE